jgi:hypothetical protein
VFQLQPYTDLILLPLEEQRADCSVVSQLCSAVPKLFPGSLGSFFFEGGYASTFLLLALGPDTGQARRKGWCL